MKLTVRRAVALVFPSALITAPACGDPQDDLSIPEFDSGASSGGSAGSAGAGGSGGTGGANLAPELEQLCADACAVAKTCERANTDVVACDAQCRLEVMGEGYLRVEIARKFFGFLRDGRSDESCEYTLGDEAWKQFGFGVGIIDSLDDRADFTRCTSLMAECDGEVNQSRYYSPCLLRYYRYSDARRADIGTTCFDPVVVTQCRTFTFFGCISERQIEGQPWLAGVTRLAPDAGNW